MITVDSLERTYTLGRQRVPALRGVSFKIEEGAMVAIMGPSGSGKSTLLNLLGCLDRASSGSYRLAGREVSSLGDDQLAVVRNQRIGFVFQSYNLLAQLTAAENVELPLIYRGLPKRERRQLAAQALQSVGLTDRARHRPLELSGGQQQRVGIARALAGEPAVILADEPTGNLDSKSGSEILRIFHRLHESGRTVIIVTHDEGIARHCERVLRLRDGLLIEISEVPENDRAAAIAGLEEEAV